MIELIEQLNESLGELQKIIKKIDKQHNALSSGIDKKQKNVVCEKNDSKGIKSKNKKGVDFMQKGSVCQRADGRWMGRYRANGKQVCVYANSSTECRKKLNGELKKYYSGDNCNCNMEFGKWLEYWYQNYKKDDLKETTAVQYKKNLKLIFKESDPLYKMPLGKLDEIVFKKYFLSIKPTQIERGLMILKDCLEIACAKGLIKRNFFSLIKVRVKKTETQKQQKKELVFSLAEQEQLINFLNSKEKELSLLFQMGIYSGLRIGELLGLKREDIEGGYVNVTKQVSISTNNIETPKTKSSIRKVPIFLGFQKALDFADGNNMFQSGYLYEIFGGDKITAIIVRFTNYLKKVNPSTSPHTMRHTFGSRLYLMKYDIKLIQRWLGHSSLATTTDTYVYVSDENVNKDFKDELLILQ